MYLKYFWSVLRHKWFVFVEACKLGVPWLGFMHDMSKFLPSEFIHYARYFYGEYPTCEEVWEEISLYKRSHYSFKLTKECIKAKFSDAWNAHQKHNKHHWQYFLLTNDSDEPQTVALEMPYKYVLEMIADWRAAGRVYGNVDAQKWYIEHKDRIILHYETRYEVEALLDI